MFEKVNPMHPDKIADRIAGAIVDLAYSKEEMPKIAVEVLIGHRQCTVIIESSQEFTTSDIQPIVDRIALVHHNLTLISAKQDVHLAANQESVVRCGDNGIFKGVPVSSEEAMLTLDVKRLYEKYPTDGKFILDHTTGRFIICQSNASTSELSAIYPDAVINPLGEWTGGTDVDTGATNRKLGSDMAQSVTGGGLMGKDCSKADVSVNIYAFLRAQELKHPVQFSCAIGDTEIDGRPYSEIVEIAKNYIDSLGGFEKFAEWGLVR